MSDTKHTPGPWEAERLGSAVVRITLGGKRIHLDGPADGNMPDARLIAAAPDLLAACERALRAIDRWPRKRTALHPHIETIQQLRAAIHKAEGGG